MSGSSSKNSGSPQKGFFKRMLSQDQSGGAKRTEVKQRHPEFTVSNEATVTPGRMSRPQEVIISPAVKQLNKDGYVVFNTPEKQDVYITVQPESAFFDDEEPEMVRMAGGSFVGAAKRVSSAEVPFRTEPEPESVVYSQPADIFSNASRREVYEEIDFNEIIIKKNESFEEEIKQTPVFFGLSSEEVSESAAEEPLMMETEQEAARASADAAENEMPAISFAGYREVPEYAVRESSVEGASAEEAPVTDVPAGLYVDGYRAIDRAEMGAEGAEEHSSFVGMLTEAETVVTSEAAPMIKCVTAPLESSAEYVGCLPIPEKTEAEAGVIAERVSETIANVPLTIDIIDPVADIMKLTVPGLYMSDELLSELAQDWEAVIPEDDLESYDFRLEPVRAPFKEEKILCAASSGSGGKEPVIDIHPSVNFRIG